MYSDDLDSVTNNLRDSAKGSLVTYDVAFTLTQRIESVTKRIHEEHIARKGQNSVLHKKLGRTFIPMHQAMKKDSRCKGSSGQGMEKA